MSSFSGFSGEALTFLADLPSRDPDWFKAHKKQYQALLADPAKAFVTAFADAIRPLVPDLVAEPKTNGSIAPINNDLRFAPDKSPYKDNLMFRFWEGGPKKHAPTLFVRLTADDVGLAAGVVPADVDGWRAAIDGPSGQAIADAVAQLVERKSADVVGQELKRVPAPFPADHPRADLLRHKMIQVRWPVKLPAEVSEPSFAEWCVEQLTPALPLHRALVEAFA